MPYVNKELKKQFQKKVLTPYMKEWREKNREHHRQYLKEWARKRRADPQKKQQDKKKAIESGAQARFKKYTQDRQREWVDNLSDMYIIELLVRKGSLTRELAKDTPQIIEIHKKLLTIKRKLKET